jgi:hypothetical protein
VNARPIKIFAHGGPDMFSRIKSIPLTYEPANYGAAQHETRPLEARTTLPARSS